MVTDRRTKVLESRPFDPRKTENLDQLIMGRSILFILSCRTCSRVMSGVEGLLNITLILSH